MQIEKNNRGECLDIRNEDRPASWYTQGFLDGRLGQNRHRPRIASLQAVKLPKKKVGVRCKVKRYEKHLERLGGKYDPKSGVWIFPEASLAVLRSDERLNSYGNLWRGVTLERFEKARDAYNKGYAAGQESIISTPYHTPKLWK